MFFELFWVFYSISKKSYKFELVKKWRIHNVFYVLLLKQNITIKERIKKVSKLNIGNNSEKYNVEAIWDGTIYAREPKTDLPASITW